MVSLFYLIFLIETKKVTLMVRVERYGFEQPSINVIKKAFLFLKQKILLCGENMKKGLDEVHHSVVDEEIKKEIGKIETVET
jgi:hypothetical protein